MRRTHARAPWVGCAWFLVSALAIVLSLAAVGDDDAAAQSKSKKKKIKKRTEDVSSCVTFGQSDAGDAVNFRFVSTCEAPLSCGVTWTLQCESWEGKKTAKTHDGVAFELESNASYLATASPATCGDDGWAIDDVSWSCTPPKK
jgi:hypothetical protein